MLIVVATLLIMSATLVSCKSRELTPKESSQLGLIASYITWLNIDLSDKDGSPTNVQNAYTNGKNSNLMDYDKLYSIVSKAYNMPKINLSKIMSELEKPFSDPKRITNSIEYIYGVFKYEITYDGNDIELTSVGYYPEGKEFSITVKDLNIVNQVVTDLIEFRSGGSSSGSAESKKYEQLEVEDPNWSGGLYLSFEINGSKVTGSFYNNATGNFASSWKLSGNMPNLSIDDEECITNFRIEGNKLKFHYVAPYEAVRMLGNGDFEVALN